MLSFQMQPVYRLLPVMGFQQQLKECIQSGYAHEQPVDWNKQCPRQEMVELPPHASQQVEIDIEEIPEDEAEGAQIKNRSREQEVIDIYHRGANGNVQAQ